jgi:hypothetical protein
MHLRVRFIGKALDYLVANGHEERTYALQIAPELVHVGDLVRHPLFPGRSVYVVAREVDLIECCVTAWIDELPGAGPYEADRDSRAAHADHDSPYPASVSVIGD